jgi:uncharacterized protein YqgV (UPF0045/DUF77 family)
MPVSVAELTAEFSVETSAHGERSPQEQVKAATEAASASGLVSETGPETMALAGARREVLDALRSVIEAALDAGAQAVRVTFESRPNRL